MRILVLSAAPESNSTKSIIKAGKKRDHEMVVVDPAYLYLLISDAVSGYDRVYDGFNHEEQPIRIKASEIDAVIPRIGENLSYGAAVLEHLNYNLGIFSTQTAIGIKTAADKLISLQKISQAKLRVPKTVLGDKAMHVSWMIKQVGGLPAIAKGLTGSQGKTVYPLKDIYQSNVFLQNFYGRKENLLLQNFINGGEKDIRAIVINGEVVAAMERTAKKGELRANISQGGTGKKIDLSKEDEQICIRAASACGLMVAGVDIMKDDNGETFVIEVNGNYGYGIETITGKDISTPLIEFCEEWHKKGNSLNKLTTYLSQVDSDYEPLFDLFNQSNLKTKSHAPDKKSNSFLDVVRNMKNDSFFKNFFN